MSTSLSPRSSPGSVHPTRPQLDELAALLQRMLELPVNAADEEPGPAARKPKKEPAPARAPAERRPEPPRPPEPEAADPLGPRVLPTPGQEAAAGRANT